MSASVIEQILATVKSALAAGLAGVTVDRGRVDGFDLAEMPAINVRRADSDSEAFAGQLDRTRPEFELEIFAIGRDWETTSDALHMDAHALLVADSALGGLARGLRNVSTEAHADQGGQTAGMLVARYQMQFLVRQADLTRPQQ